ncbi:MAG: hypothetical protein ACK4M7_01400 [Burkholderiales bacterium]
MKKALLFLCTFISYSAFATNPVYLSGEFKNNKIYLQTVNSTNSRINIKEVNFGLEDGTLCYSKKLDKEVDPKSKAKILVINKSEFQDCLASAPGNYQLEQIVFGPALEFATISKQKGWKEYRGLSINISYTSGRAMLHQPQTAYVVLGVK